MGFVVKEIAILTGRNMNHWIFLPPTNFEDLSRAEKRQIVWLTKNHHKFEWNYGFEEYENCEKLIQNALHDVDYVYVKGSQKPSWLKLFLNEHIKIQNVENLEFNLMYDKFNFFFPYQFRCVHHEGVCSVFNVYKINAILQKYIKLM